jgi:hypothetical protein
MACSKVDIMPDVNKLSPTNKQRLLGCVAKKNEAWKKKNKKTKVPQDVNQSHYRECSQQLGLE